MKQIFLTLMALCSMLSVAQNKQLLYDFTEIPQSLLLNPGAEVRYKGYIGIPLLSGVSLQAGSSGFSAHTIFADDGVSINTKIRNLIYDMSERDQIHINQQMEIFSGGFSGSWDSNRYYSFGMYQELDILAYWPKDLAILAYQGNANSLEKAFDLSHANAQGELITAFHFGVHQKVNQKLSLGARAKIYSSILNITSNANTGSFYTTTAANNLYRHVIGADFALQTSGVAGLADVENIGSLFASRAFLGGNLGLGLDLGFTYHANDKLSFTGSILDIGFISHTKNVENYEIKGQYNLDGIALDFAGSSSNPTTADYWQNLVDDLDKNLGIKTTHTKYTTWRDPKFNASLKYAFGDDYRNAACGCSADTNRYSNALGMQLYTIWRSRGPQMAATAFYYKKLANFLRLKATYTVDKFSYKNVGLGMSTHFGKINFYLMVDNLLEFQNLAKSQSASMQFGFNFIIPESKSPY